MGLSGTLAQNKHSRECKEPPLFILGRAKQRRILYNYQRKPSDRQM